MASISNPPTTVFESPMSESMLPLISLVSGTIFGCSTIKPPAQNAHVPSAINASTTSSGMGSNAEHGSTIGPTTLRPVNRSVTAMAPTVTAGATP